MKIHRCGLLSLVAAFSLVGCGTVYSWRPAVPSDRRSVAVPTFRNSSTVPGFGSVLARQLAREFQREGTFSIESVDDAALEVQGNVVSFQGRMVASDRHGSRISSYEATASVKVTVVDHLSQKLLINDRVYEASVTYSAGGDALNAKRDVSGRLADELARRVVDDVLNLKW